MGYPNFIDWNRWKEVDGWFNKVEAVTLYNLVKEMPHGGSIVEIGCYRGKSTVIILSAIRDSGDDKSLTVVDLFFGNGTQFGEPDPMEQDAFKSEMLENIERFNVMPSGDRFSVNVMSSFDWFKKNNGRMHDLIFIDACHQLAASDLMLAWPLLNSGGYAVCHDYSLYYPEVVKTIDATGIKGKGLGVVNNPSGQRGNYLWVAKKP